MNRVKTIGLSLAVVTALGLSGCGGSSSDGSSSSSDDSSSSDTENSSRNLDGTFATGKGQEGTILVKGAKGNKAFGVSNGDGTFSIDVDSLTAPYKLKAETVDKETIFYSYAANKTYTNINQITTKVLEEASDQDLNYLFKNNDQLNEKILNDAKEAIKSDLLVQIYTSGLKPDEINIFKDKFTTNKLGYDALLEKVADDGAVKEETTLTVEEAKNVQRILSQFYAKDDNGKLTLDIEKFNKDLFNDFYSKIVENAYNSGRLAIVQMDTDKIKYALKNSGKNLADSALYGGIKQLAIEFFGSSLSLSDADTEFITQMSSVAFKNNFYDAVGTMYRGLKGEDTSVIYEPLLEALHNSTLGDPVVAAEKLNDFVGTHGAISSVVCHIPILNIGREESCKYIDEGGVPEYIIDFNDFTSVEVTPNQSGFQVTNISPSTGVKTTDLDAITVEFNQDLYQGFFSEQNGITTAAMNILNTATNEPVVCDALELFEKNTIKCSLNNNQIKYNSKYAFSVTAKNADQNESLSIMSTFTTPSYLVKNIEISKESGKYNDGVDVTIAIPDGYEIYYTLNSSDLSKENAIPYTDGTLITVDETSALRVVAYDGKNIISPMVRKIYNIVAMAVEEIDKKETPIDTSSLTVAQCQEKTVNTTFETTTWASSLTEWNDVHLACLPILAGASSDDVNIDKSEITSLDYMKTHSTEKLSSSDCKAYAGGSTVGLEWIGSTLSTPLEKIKGWGDVKGVLAGDLAPSSNMMKSIYACDKAQQMVKTGQVDFGQAINSVNTMSEPFSDSPAVSGFSTGVVSTPSVSTGTSPSTPSSSTVALTLSQCETDYGHYTTSEWAQNAGDRRVDACYQALVAAPMIGMDGQLYIDSYNAGAYN